jgi:hypothetical protein
MKASRLTMQGVMATAIMVLATTASHALNIAASSSGYGLEVDIDVLGLGIDVGPLPVGVSGSAPGPYGDSDSVLNVSVISSIPLVVSGDVGAAAVNASIASDVDGLSGSRTTSASGGVVGADISAVTLPFLGPGLTILGLDGTLSSTASISGDWGTLVAMGSTTIESVGLTISGIPVNLSAYVNVPIAPNTSVNLAALGILNASLILNEQIIAPDNSSIEVNAFHLTLGLLNIGGEVILGHSQVSMTAIPEPGSMLLGGLGFGLAIFRRQR